MHKLTIAILTYHLLCRDIRTYSCVNYVHIRMHVCMPHIYLYTISMW